MDTVGDGLDNAATDLIDRQHNNKKTWFCWFNSTRMHFGTYVHDENRNKDFIYSTDGRNIREIPAMPTPCILDHR